MDGRKQSLKRTESRTSTHSRANSVKWKDRFLSPTFHDVQIEQVQIVEPPPGNGQQVVARPKLDRRSAGGRSSVGLTMFAPPPSEEGSLVTDNSEERRAFRENYLYQASERTPSRRMKSRIGIMEPIMRSDDPAQAPSVPLVNLPLEPPGTVIPRERATRQQSRQKLEVVEQRHRQKVAILRHMQRLQTNESPQQRRLMSGTTSKKKTKRYYEVSPGVILSELPLEENHPRTVPDNETELLDEPIFELYERRAKTVPHITKSIIWTAKNRVASSRAVSSTSSRWKGDEYSEMEHNKKANIFVKMPFKQCPCVTMSQDKQADIIDDLVRPGYELRLTTAFTVSRVKKGINRLDPPPTSSGKRGQLLKARLKPLYPVKAGGPTIYSCQGIQPEARAAKKNEGYTPSPSRQRQLKDQLNKLYDEHRVKREEYERKMIRAQSANSRESVHLTSPEPGNADGHLRDDLVLNQTNGLDDIYNGLAVSNQLDSLHIESGVIF